MSVGSADILDLQTLRELSEAAEVIKEYLRIARRRPRPSQALFAPRSRAKEGREGLPGSGSLLSLEASEEDDREGEPGYDHSHLPARFCATLS